MRRLRIGIDDLQRGAALRAVDFHRGIQNRGPNASLELRANVAGRRCPSKHPNSITRGGSPVAAVR